MNHMNDYHKTRKNESPSIQLLYVVEIEQWTFNTPAKLTKQNKYEKKNYTFNWLEIIDKWGKWSCHWRIYKTKICGIFLTKLN